MKIKTLIDKADNGITAKDISEKTKLDFKTVEKELSNLVSKNLVYTGKIEGIDYYFPKKTVCLINTYGDY
jgi:predicted transcriptional regulator